VRPRDSPSKVAVCSLWTGSRTRRRLVQPQNDASRRTQYEDTLKDFKGSDKVFHFSQTNDGSTVVMNSEYGLLVSKDRAETWSGVSILTARGEVEILAVAVAPTNGDVIMYATANTFYRSTSGGSAWETSELPSGRSVGTVVINPANEEAVILGTVTPEE